MEISTSEYLPKINWFCIEIQKHTSITMYTQTRNKA